MKFRVKYFFLALILAYSCHAEEEPTDTVRLKTGEVLTGRIIKSYPKKHIKFKKSTSNTDTIIHYSDVENFVDNQFIPANLYYANYGFIGLNFGTPGLLNIMGGYMIGPAGVSICGIHTTLFWGYQANLKFKLYDDSKKSGSLNLVYGDGGIAFNKFDGGGLEDSNEYLGLAFDWTYNYIWFEFGVCGVLPENKGENKLFEEYRLLVQLGLVLRFTK